jgi:hypothetical protein
MQSVLKVEEMDLNSNLGFKDWEQKLPFRDLMVTTFLDAQNV